MTREMSGTENESHVLFLIGDLRTKKLSIEEWLREAGEGLQRRAKS